MTAPSTREVESWLSRIDEITSAVQELLSSDPLDDIERHQAREKRRAEQQEMERKAKLEQIKMRYEPKNYARFERDDVIDAMLKAVDEKPKEQRDLYDTKDESLFTKAERVSLEEAQRLKDEGAKCVQKADWGGAYDCYDNALKLHPVDPRLVIILHNNKALACNKTGKYLEAVEDASFVLQKEAKNVKALLRRGTALRYLHRPVEALQDVTKALQLEPTNSEGLLMRTWLRKAEEELRKRDLFMTQNEQASAEVSEAAKTLKASASDEASLGEKQLGALGTALRVIQEHGTGASVLFAFHGGVGQSLSIATSLTSKCSTSELAAKDVSSSAEVPEFVAPLLTSLRVLSCLFEESETVSQDASAESMTTFIESCCNTTLKTFVELNEQSRNIHPLFQAIVNATLECLTSLCAPYAAQLHNALEASWSPLSSIWKVLRAALASSAPVKRLELVTLYQFTRLITACMHAKGAEVRMPDDGGSSSVLNQMFQPPVTAGLQEKVEANSEMVLDVVEFCLRSDAPLAVQTVGVALALRRTALSVSAASGAKRPSPAQWTQRSWLKKICLSIIQSLRVCQQEKADLSQHFRFLEACYSLLFNLSLSGDRAAFVDLVQGLNSPSLGERTWDYVASQRHVVTRSHLMPPLSKMLGVLAKFVARDLSLKMTIRSAVGGEDGFPIMWEIFEGLMKDCAPLTSDTWEGDRGMQWLLLEHSSTILANVYQGGSSTSLEQENGHLLQSRGLRALFSLVKVASLPSEAAVHLFKATHVAAVSSPGAHSTTLIALGNSAILIAYMLDACTSANRSSVNGVLQEMKAVDVLLDSIRGTRTALLMLARERADAESKQMTAVVPQLKLWEGYTSAAQKNLGIAISKTATFSEDMRSRLRDLNGIEVLATILGK